MEQLKQIVPCDENLDISLPIVDNFQFPVFGMVYLSLSNEIDKCI